MISLAEAISIYRYRSPPPYFRAISFILDFAGDAQHNRKCATNFSRSADAIRRVTTSTFAESADKPPATRASDGDFASIMISAACRRLPRFRHAPPASFNRPGRRRRASSFSWAMMHGYFPPAATSKVPRAPEETASALP